MPFLQEKTLGKSEGRQVFKWTQHISMLVGLCKYNNSYFPFNEQSSICASFLIYVIHISK